MNVRGISLSLVPWEAKNVSQETFSDTLIGLEAFKRIFVFRPKMEFFLAVSPCFLAENDQIFKSALLTCLCF